MKYDIHFKPKAVSDVEDLPSRIQARVLARIEKNEQWFERRYQAAHQFYP
jgi:mRNA-degrading endonuclease RelE of RelBE toxin-antitoxin system